MLYQRLPSFYRNRNFMVHKKIDERREAIPQMYKARLYPFKQPPIFLLDT